MKPRLDDKDNIFELGKAPRGFLQVLLPSFTLTKQEGGRLLEVKVDGDALSIDSSAGKREFFHAIAEAGNDGRQRLKAELDCFSNDESLLSRRFDCAEHPLRYGNGGVLPIIRLEGSDYFCLFYRDIFPIGWNIANGASDTLEEMLNPEKIILREFGEELLICDHGKKTLYTFHPGAENAPPGFQKEALKAWKMKFPGRALDRYERLPIPLKWIAGPDRVSVQMGELSRSSDGYFVNITPEDNAIEVDRIALIKLEGNVAFFDGECTQRQVLNRIVGLFKPERIEKGLKGAEFIPDLLFCDGKRRKPRDLRSMVARYLKALKPPIRTPTDKQGYKDEMNKFDLCPITRAMIGRYFKWVKQWPPDQPPAEAARVKTMVAHPMKCQVFISHRSPDHEIAVALYRCLTDEGYRVFCCEESLPRLGESDYVVAIDKALEAARCLVVLGTRPEYFDSGWVGYEWRSFFNEIRSDRKRKGKVFTLASGVEVRELPFALRSQQVIPFLPASPQDAFESLKAFIGRALER